MVAQAHVLTNFVQMELYQLRTALGFRNQLQEPAIGIQLRPQPMEKSWRQWRTEDTFTPPRIQGLPGLSERLLDRETGGP